MLGESISPWCPRSGFQNEGHSCSAMVRIANNVLGAPS